MDDIAGGDTDEEAAYPFYVKTKVRLAEAGFNLKKFAFKCERLMARAHGDESDASSSATDCTTVTQDVQSYAKNRHTGLRCPRCLRDTITKHQALSASSRIFDPLAFITPVTVALKMFIHELCKAKLEWDQPLVGEQLATWRTLVTGLTTVEPVSLPRWYFHGASSQATVSLHGFCDTFVRAFAAVVYLVSHGKGDTQVQLVAKHSRVTPVT